MKRHPLVTILSILAILSYLAAPVSAAPLPQAPTPEERPADAAAQDGGTGITAIDLSTVNYMTPASPPVGTSNVCFNVTIESNDEEYMDRFDIDLPDSWTINSVADVPGTGCGSGHTRGVEAGNVAFWQTNGYPPQTGCGDWSPDTYNFCANVTVPDCSGSPYTMPWNIIGDGYGEPPHQVSGSIAAACGLPGQLEGNIYDGDTQPEILTGGIDSLSGSYVRFNPSAGGEACYAPSTPNTYCFDARTTTDDGEYLNELFVRFPTDWTVTDAYVSGTPTCSAGGAFGAFSWDLPFGNDYELHIDHFRMMDDLGDDCLATYCVAATPGTSSTSALESWYYAGDQWGGTPHQVCSSDGYTPAGYDPCEEAVNLPALIPSCSAGAPCTPPTVTINPGAISAPVDPLTGHYGPVELASGDYTVTATAPGYSTETTAITVPGGVTTTQDFILLRPVIDVYPLSISASSLPDTPIVVPVDISNLGHLDLTWEITEPVALDWVSFTPAAGTNPPLSYTQVDVTLACAPEQAGTVITGTLEINNNDPCQCCGGIIEIPVELNCLVPPAPDINLVPVSLSETLVQGDTSVLTLNVENLADGTLNWTIAEGCAPEDIPWVSASPASGVTEGNDSYPVDVTFDSTGLATGVYTDDLCVDSNDPDEPSVVVPLSLTVSGPEIDVTPLSLEAMQQTDQITTQPLNICNSGDLPLTWSITETVQSIMFPPIILPIAGASVPAEGTFTAAMPGLRQPQAVSIQPRARIIASPDVLLLAADSATAIQAILNAYGTLGLVDYFDAEFDTPTLAELQVYDVVITWSNYFYADPAGIGDVLADYVDSGGKVINLNGSMGTHGWQMSGRFMTENYTAMNGTNVNFIPACLGPYNAEHPIFAGVTSVCDLGRISGTYLTPNSITIAEWNDGQLFIAANNAVPVVSINAFIGDTYAWTGQMADILYNTIIWLAFPTVDIPWVSESPLSGTVAGGACQVVDVTFDSTGLDLDTYHTDLLIESNDLDEHWLTLPVTLTVVEPDIDVSPLAIAMTLESGFNGVQNFTIANTGTGILSYDLSEAAPWLSLNVTSGTVPADGSQVIIATFDAAGMTAGVYTADITIASDDPDEPSIIVTATLTVLAADIEITAPPLDVSMCADATTPLLVNICNQGDANLEWNAAESPAASWLSEVPTSGSLAPTACQDVFVVFDSTGLAPGMYTSSLVVTSDDPVEPSITLPVSLEVFQPAAITDVTYTITGLDVAFDATAAGELPLTYAWEFGDGGTSSLEDPTYTYPAYDTYSPVLTVSNICGADTWTDTFTLCEPPAGADFTWLPASPLFGETVTFTASLESGSDDLTYAWDWGDGETGTGQTASHAFTAGGEYEVTLTVTNDCGEVTADHTVTVIEPDIEVSPLAITATLMMGETGTGVITITNTGTADLHVIDITGLLTWLSIPYTQTTILPGESEVLTFTFDTDSLPAGTYGTTVLIHSDDPDTPAVAADVNLVILEKPQQEFTLYMPVVIKAE